MQSKAAHWGDMSAYVNLDKLFWISEVVSVTQDWLCPSYNKNIYNFEIVPEVVHLVFEIVPEVAHSAWEWMSVDK